jgi:hypothetical protein
MWDGRSGRARIALLLALIAALLISIAATAPGQVVRAGTLIVTVEGGFTPKRLPSREPAPITLKAKSTLETADGGRLPIAKTLTLDFDKHTDIDTTGLPKCSVGKLHNTLTAQAERICASSLVGTGRAGAEIYFPEQPPFFASGEMLIFNGPPKGGQPRLIFHVYAMVPAPTTFVTTADMSRLKGGIYGTRVVIKIPTIVAGQGSLSFAELQIRKSWTHRGKKRDLLLATCPTGRFFVRGDLSFTDGTKMAGKVLRTCTPAG